MMGQRSIGLATLRKSAIDHSAQPRAEIAMILITAVTGLVAWFWSKSHKNAGPTYVFRINSLGERIYHRSDCAARPTVRRATKECASQRELFQRGYRPCKVCMPDRNPCFPNEWVPSKEDWMGKQTGR
jgi:hypothetical protein